MNQSFKKIMFLSITAVILIFSLSMSIYSALSGNWRECLNIPGCTCGLTTAAASDLSIYIMESAGFFFNSHSAFQSFLNRVELSELKGVDSEELKFIFGSARDNMEKARAAYAGFMKVSKKIPFNQTLIDQLLKFNYTDFQVRSGLIKSQFDKVAAFLSKGDIKGLDAAILANMDNILTQLDLVKASLDTGEIPDISILWRLNQSYLEAQLFGQYLSEILRANI